MDEGRRVAWEAAIEKLRRREEVSPEEHCDLLREGMFEGVATPDVFEEADLFLDYWLHHLSIDPLPWFGEIIAGSWFRLREWDGEWGSKRAETALRDYVAADDFDHWAALNLIAARLYRERELFPDTLADWAANVHRSLRVRPETLCRITEFSEHESNGRELDEGERVAVEVLPVLGQSAAAVEPGDGAFDHPTPGLDDEALHPIGSLDDLGLEIGQDAGQGAVKDRPLIGAVGEQFPEKGKQTEQGRQQRETAVAILNVGGGDDAVQQQALRIDQNMPLLALDQLAGIEAVAVDASPPFSALFTL